MSGVSPQLLARVRELMRLKLNASAADALQSAPQDLQTLGAEAQSHEEHQLLLRAVDAAAALAAQGFLVHFEDAVQQTFDEKIGWLSGTKDAGGHGFAEFNLLDDAVLAQQMGLRKLVQKSLDEIDGGSLYAIEIRMADVLGVPKADGVRNPLGPGTVLKAVRSVLERLVEGEDVQDVLVNVFQPHLTAGLNALYDDLNEIFIAAGIRADYRPQIERDKSNRQAIRKSVDGVQISQAMSLRDLLPGSISSPINLADILATLLQGQETNRKYGARMLADEEGVLYAQALNTGVNPELLQALTQMQTGVGSAGQADVPDLKSAIERMQQAEEHPLDRLTGELVMVIFDFLLNEKELAEPVREQIGRLQIVALKAALLDRSFFARREHPLRILLGDMTRKGGDPLIDARPGSDFVLGLRAIVDELIRDFDSDLSLFESACRRLEALGAEAEQSKQSDLHELTDTLLAQEREGQARAQSQEAVRRVLRPDTPAFLSDFLQRYWTQRLVSARLQEDELAWHGEIESMESLVASVQSKTRQEMPAFTASLPSLVKALQKGLSGTDITEEEQRAFMDALMNAHTEILQKAHSGEIQSVSPVPSAAVQLPYESAARIGPRAALLPERALVEFKDTTPPTRARLSWVSPGRSRYAFIAASAAPRIFTAEELSNALASDLVRVLAEEETLLHRALAMVVGDREAAS